MAKFKIKHTITKKEWNKKHKDFKTIIDGVPYVMMYDDKTGTYLAPVKIVDESVIKEFMMPHHIDSAMKEMGISKIPISSQGERVLKGMVKEKFLNKITNVERLIYFVESLGDQKFGYGTKGKPLSPLVDRFWNDITSDAIFFGGKMAAYQVVMNIKDRLANDEEVDSTYYMLKDYFNSFGMDTNRSRVFKSAMFHVDEWLKRNKKIASQIGESMDEAMDFNDPILIKLRASAIEKAEKEKLAKIRAAQMKKNQMAAKKIEQTELKIKALKKKRAEVMRDMEQEAEVEGGPIADRYGNLLNKIDNDIIKLGGNPMSESVNENQGLGKLDAKRGKDVDDNPFKPGTKQHVDWLKGFEFARARMRARNEAVKIKMNNLDWGKSTAERNANLDKYDSLKTDKEREAFLRKLKGESVNENDGVYFKSYTAAIEAARAAALKKGFEVDDDEMFTKVGMNSKRPSVGKTTRVSLELTKAGKPQRKMLHIQVYGMKNGYELNSYIN